VAIEQETQASVRREVVGRYLARVEALAANGEALVRVVATVSAPSPEEIAQVFAGRAGGTVVPEALTCIGGLPGELVELEVTWTKPPVGDPVPRPGRKRARRAPPPAVRVAAVREASPDRTEPRCTVFGACGGCQLQHLAYPKQLEWKTARVRSALVAAGLADPPVLPALGCEPPWHYRNQMRFSVNRDGQAGLTLRGSRHVLPLAQCPIAHPHINAALEAFAGEALLRPQALVRCGDATGQVLIQPPPSDAVRRRLAAQGLEVRDDTLEERLLDVPFHIRPSSFFQTNTRQANRMAELVLDRLPRGRDVTLVDAYCGVGTFARLMAAQAGHVVAIEESASAIRDARGNLGGAANVTIVSGKVEEILPGMTERVDGLVIDPPRAGCQRPVLDALVARRVPVVVYVSCDPDTLARDLDYICNTQGAYRLVSVQPLDMFPQTAHIESVAALEAVAAQ
jgi:23S rRNA (uracil1939-C5)-methyltransferase